MAAGEQAKNEDRRPMAMLQPISGRARIEEAVMIGEKHLGTT